MRKYMSVLLAWSSSFAAALAWFVVYIRRSTSNVPMTDGVLVFMQYYLAFGVLFGWAIYLACRAVKKNAIRAVAVAASHGCFLWLLFFALERLPAGSFFSGYAP